MQRPLWLQAARTFHEQEQAPIEWCLRL